MATAKQKSKSKEILKLRAALIDVDEAMDKLRTKKAELRAKIRGLRGN